MSDKVSQNKLVSLIYTITDETDKVLERNDTPIQYIQGVITQQAGKYRKDHKHYGKDLD